MSKIYDIICREIRDEFLEVLSDKQRDGWYVSQFCTGTLGDDEVIEFTFVAFLEKEEPIDSEVKND